MSKQKEFIGYVLNLLVDKPEAISIEEQEGEKSIVYKVKADINDYGKIIGRRGRSIDAIRTLLSVVSRNSDKRCAINVLDRFEREGNSSKDK